LVFHEIIERDHEITECDSEIAEGNRRDSETHGG
jgi:hypothetical protein